MERVNSPGAILSRDNVILLLVTARQRAGRDKAGLERKSPANFRAAAAAAGGPGATPGAGNGGAGRGSAGDGPLGGALPGLPPRT